MIFRSFQDARKTNQAFSLDEFLNNPRESLTDPGEILPGTLADSLGFIQAWS